MSSLSRDHLQVREQHPSVSCELCILVMQAWHRTDTQFLYKAMVMASTYIALEKGSRSFNHHTQLHCEARSVIKSLHR